MLRIILLGLLVQFPLQGKASTQEIYSLGETVGLYQGCKEHSAIVAILFFEDQFDYRAAKDLFIFFANRGYCGYYPLSESDVTTMHEGVSEESRSAWFRVAAEKRYFFWQLRSQPVRMTNK